MNDPKMGQGRKTHEQQFRTFERKPDVPDPRNPASMPEREPGIAARDRKDKARQSEFPISHRGMNQESKHNKKRSDGT